jgi:organic radical activating enzyme
LLDKFSDPDRTAKGEVRARVALRQLETLWINTGTLCNITCRNCYIESSPTNDRLAYITLSETAPFFDEAKTAGATTIGFTGGEPFLNPEAIELIEAALTRGFDALVLTNAMLPMQRPQIKTGLLKLKQRYGDHLTLRVSLDHYTRNLHETERGPGTFDKTLAGLDWLNSKKLSVAIAGRTCWNEDKRKSRAGYAALISERGWSINPDDEKQLTLLPEMDARYDAPEITTACWDILKLDPSSLMCASSRMIVKRRGAERPVVTPCTLLPYDESFAMGPTLAAAAQADGGMFDAGAVKLCHTNCATFCVLGGGSCS